MRKIILVPVLLLLISSCTLPFAEEKKDESFGWLYTANVRSTVASYAEIGTYLGINRHENINGMIKSSISVPNILSGSLSSEYSWLIDGRNSESFFRNVQVLFTSLVNSGSLSVDEIGFVSHSTDSFVSYKNINDVGLIPESIKTILKKYENTWLNIAQQAVSEMSGDELMGYTIGKNLLTKSLSDVEKYATDFPIWKNTADLGMSGSIHTWLIELDRANILALSKKLAQDLSGTGMSDEYAKNLESNLAALSFSGKIGFDASNPKFSTIEGTITFSGKLVAEVAMSKNENNGSVSIGNSEEKTTIALNYWKTDTKYSIDGSIRKDSKEMGKMNAYVESKDGKFQELSIEASAQGMTISMKHTMNGDKFVGKLSAIVATIDWSGIVSNDHLMGLKIDWASPLGSFSTDLVNDGSDTMIRGPVVVKSGDETLVSANLELELASEKLSFIIDVLSEQFPVHFDMMITWKTTPSDKSVTLPSNTKSLQDFIKEIDSLNIPEIVESPAFDPNLVDSDIETQMDDAFSDVSDSDMVLPPQ